EGVCFRSRCLETGLIQFPSLPPDGQDSQALEFPVPVDSISVHPGPAFVEKLLAYRLNAWRPSAPTRIPFRAWKRKSPGSPARLKRKTGSRLAVRGMIRLETEGQPGRRRPATRRS